ncbi:MAG: OmpH family outer membrane protein [Flavobacteriaceae bacterium]|nr:OmpH family outer membrane protein [Flavobacteriaceae bacterium]
MKLLKNLLLIGVIFIGYTTQAQVKIAHINTDELVQAMPETKQMQDELKKVAQAYDAEYKNQVSEYQTKAQKYDQEAPTQTDAENQKRAQEMQELSNKIQLYGQTAQQELQKKQFDLLKPIEDKATKAINDVAAEKGIQYVFDSSPGKGLLVYKGEDLLPAVKAKLGIK